MGQEKSLPIRCNSCHNYSSSITLATTTTSSSSPSSSPSSKNLSPAKAPQPTTIFRSPSRSTTNSTSAQSTTTTLNTTRTRSSDISTAALNASYKSIENQTQYLKKQLYIKTYLDIVEEDRTAKLQFQPARSGIRNYTPKILLDQIPSTSVSSSSSNEQEDLDIWI